jgi:hypothetical protein
VVYECTEEGEEGEEGEDGEEGEGGEARPEEGEGTLLSRAPSRSRWAA